MLEIAHQNLTEIHVVDSMHERKALMAELAEGFITLPGGSGTLEEWFEVFTWAQLDYHHKPCVLLNIKHYYDPIIALFNHMISEGFVKEAYKDLILLEETPNNLIKLMQDYKPRYIHKW